MGENSVSNNHVTCLHVYHTLALPTHCFLVDLSPNTNHPKSNIATHFNHTSLFKIGQCWSQSKFSFCSSNSGWSKTNFCCLKIKDMVDLPVGLYPSHYTIMFVAHWPLIMGIFLSFLSGILNNGIDSNHQIRWLPSGFSIYRWFSQLETSIYLRDFPWLC